MLAPEGWGRNLAPLGRCSLMVMLHWVSGLQRDHACGLVDEEYSHGHTKRSPVSILGPHAWPVTPATERNWTGPPFWHLSALITNQPRGYSEWLEALSSTPHQPHCHLSALPSGEPHTRPGQARFASAWSCKACHQPSSWNIYIYTGRVLTLFPPIEATAGKDWIWFVWFIHPMMANLSPMAHLSGVSLTKRAK